MILVPVIEVKQETLNSFSCGNKELDTFLIKYAKQNDQNGYGRTFCLIDENFIVGYFTLCSSSICFEELPTNLSINQPRYPVPCIKIARLGVSKLYQGKGYGAELLKQTFLKILSVADTVGIRLIIVDAKESSALFYEKYGFRNFPNKRLIFYLLLDTLKQAI